MKLGVLLINTGTPDAPTLEAVRRYLREFLMDPAIIGAPVLVRKAMVSHIVRNRPARTVKHYEAFWTSEGSPFLLTSYAQRDALQKALSEALNNECKASNERASAPKECEGVCAGDNPRNVCGGASGNTADVHVELAMRYGNPSIQSALLKLREKGCTHLVFLPAYPQNVNVCAGTCLKEAHAQLEKLVSDAVRHAEKEQKVAQLAEAARGQAQLKTPTLTKPQLATANQNLNQNSWNPKTYDVRQFYDIQSYRDALTESVIKNWNYVPGAKLAVSFHSTMMSDIRRDSTYLRQTTQTKDWLAQDLHEAIGIPKEDVMLCFQSRFDSRKWLSPFTEHVLKTWVREGVKNICVVCPGFVADNIETVVEVNKDLRDTVCKSACSAQDNTRAGKNASGASMHFVPAHKNSHIEGTHLAPPGHFPQNAPDIMNQVAREVEFTYVPALGTHPGLINAMSSAVLATSS